MNLDHYKDRFWSKVCLPGPSPKLSRRDKCWEWEASTGSHGYGQFSSNGRPEPAHRIAYQLVVGDPPASLDLDHVCNNKVCVNPWHLRPMSRGANISRPFWEKTHCKRGHELNEENTYIRPSGRRNCRPCRKVYQ